MAKEKKPAGPFEVRARRVSGGQEELMGTHDVLEQAEDHAKGIVERVGHERVTIIDQSTQLAVSQLDRDAPQGEAEPRPSDYDGTSAV